MDGNIQPFADISSNQSIAFDLDVSPALTDYLDSMGKRFQAGSGLFTHSLASSSYQYAKFKWIHLWSERCQLSYRYVSVI
jgi:hypothetical protein